jgi:hypothetical protein
LAQLRFFGYLADLIGTRTKEVPLENSVPLGGLLPSSFPRENIVILIDEKPGGMESMITNESSVVLMPVLSGG